MKEVHEVLFLTLSTAVILQEQTRTHQIECFPINQWEPDVSSVFTVMHHCTGSLELDG